MLYPLKFNPILKDKIWGGEKLKKLLNKIEASEKCGESWEISGVQDNLSHVENGPLAGNNIQELIEVYMGDLVGDSVYQKFGVEFPLLIKFIDANDILSLQVHPDDKLAKKRHKAYGKTEMWYVMQAEEGAELISGFNRELNKDMYLEKLNGNNIREILNYENVSQGDVFYIPAGRVHATGAGILFAEIQQTSDITYRIFDWDRKDKDGNYRELHTELAIDAIDFKKYESYRSHYENAINRRNEMVSCDYFTTNFVHIHNQWIPDYQNLDSFVIFICMEGKFTFDYNGEHSEKVSAGDTLLLPAVLKDIKIIPEPETKFLEVYIK